MSLWSLSSDPKSLNWFVFYHPTFSDKIVKFFDTYEEARKYGLELRAYLIRKEMGGVGVMIGQLKEAV